jgi:thioesterase domain-containing protein
MAQQLCRQGDEVGLLAMIDSPYPISIKKSETMDDAMLVAYVSRDLGAIFGKDLQITAAELRQFSLEEQLNRVLKQAKKLSVLPPEVNPRQMHQLLQVFKANNQALYRYIPHPYPGCITFFSASQEGVEDDPGCRWSELASGGMELHRISGDHYEIVRKPHVQFLANKLVGCLSKAHEML